MAQKVTKLLKMAPSSHQTFFVIEKVTKLAKTLQRSHFTEFQRFLIRWHGQCGVEEYSKGAKMAERYYPENCKTQKSTLNEFKSFGIERLGIES